MDVPGESPEADQSLTGRAASGARWSATGSAVTTVIQLVQLAVVTHFVSPTEFGLLALVQVVLAYGSAFTDAGFSQAIIYRQNNSREQLASVYTLGIILGMILFAAASGVAPVVASLFREPRLTRLIPLAAVSFLCTPFGQVFQSVLQQQLRFRLLAVVDIGTALAGAITAIVLAIAGRGVVALIVGALAAAATRAVLLNLMGRRSLRLSWRIRREDLRPYAGFGGFQLGERMLNLTSVNVDKIIIGSVLGTHALGVYNIAYQLTARPLQFVNPILNRVAFPVFARTQNDDQRLRRGYVRLIEIAALVGFPIYFGMLAVAAPLFLTVFGPQWAEAIPVFRPLCIMGVLWTIHNPIGTLLLAKGRADWGMYFNVVAVATYSAAMLVGAHFGLVGVAEAMIIASLLFPVPLEFWVRWRLIKLRPSSFIGAFSASLFASIAMFLVVTGYLVAAQGLSHLVQLISAALLGAVVYAVVSVTWSRDRVRQLWAATR